MAKRGKSETDVLITSAALPGADVKEESRRVDVWHFIMVEEDSPTETQAKRMQWW